LPVATDDDDKNNDSSIQVYFDGLCLPVNPGGVPCYAYLVKKDGKILKSAYGVAAEPLSEQATNNVAEYTALIKALEWLLENGYGQSSKVEVKGDSQLVVRQMSGQYRVKNRQIIPLFQKAAVLRKKFADLEITWVPREQNNEADRLSERAYNEAILENPSLLDKLMGKKARGNSS
jgi:ribonuclease HI